MSTKSSNNRQRLTKALIATTLLAAAQSWAQHPGPQARPGLPTQLQSADGTRTTAITAHSLLPEGANELPYVEANARDMFGEEMPNTLPSRPGNPFNLHAGPVVVTDIDPASPKEDLQAIIDDARQAAKRGALARERLQMAVDILEGNPIPGRAYSGFALLHYTGPEKVKRVRPIFDANGRKVGGSVEVRQIWFDNHIESDTALLDPSDVQDVPWTVNYVIDVLKGGADDFSPFVMYFDAPPPGSGPGVFGPPHVAMDASFYPVREGKRHRIGVNHAPAKYFNLTYTWGWREHPPRIQAMENALKTAGPLTLVEWEVSTFGPAPRSSEAAKLAAIAKIGDLSPAKRMWRAFREARNASPEGVSALMMEASLALRDWSDRTHLPRGVQASPDADVVLFFVNNTIYGNARSFDNWNGRGTVFRTTLLNGDNFTHGYVNVDFGGARGWENQYQDAGGPAASHTFGRVHWWMNAGPVVLAPAAADGSPTRHDVEITLNHDGPQRIKLYSFDPFHHDTAIYSVH